MCFGLEVGDGWYELIDELCSKLEPLGAEALQVKEKFGSLSFYVSGPNEAHKLSAKYGQKSLKICEWCGAPGEKRTDDYWIKTLCDECQNERISKRNK